MKHGRAFSPPSRVDVGATTIEPPCSTMTSSASMSIKPLEQPSVEPLFTTKVPEYAFTPHSSVSTAIVGAGGRLEDGGEVSDAPSSGALPPSSCASPPSADDDGAFDESAGAPSSTVSAAIRSLLPHAPSAT